MSDTSQGPGWWLASDGKWYPPQGESAPVPPPPPAPAPAAFPAPGAPPVPPMAGGPPAPPKSGMSGCVKAGLIIGAIVIVLGVAGVVALAFAGKKVADNVNDSIQRSALDSLEDDAGNDVDVLDGQLRQDAFCTAFKEIDDVTNRDDAALLDQAEQQERFEGFEGMVDVFEGLAPDDVTEEAELVAEFYREFHGQLEDVDFDPEQFDLEELGATLTDDRREALGTLVKSCPDEFGN